MHIRNPTISMKCLMSALERDIQYLLYVPGLSAELAVFVFTNTTNTKYKWPLVPHASHKYHPCLKLTGQDLNSWHFNRR